jgi:DNA-binding transcriptional ArsR family regulator
MDAPPPAPTSTNDKGVPGDAALLMTVPLYQAKAEFFKTLGHPARIRILELLSEREYPVHELLDNIAIEPSNLSQQLAVLRRASLVISHRHGGEVTYSISTPEVRDLLLVARHILSGLIHVDDEGEHQRPPARAR